MRIKTLTLTNFRNFKQVDEIVFPSAPLLVAAAPNATGKTNFLESIFFLLRGKSFRALTSDCVKWGEDFFAVGARVNRRGGDSFVAAQYQLATRTLRLEEDEVPASLATFYSQYPFVLFLPEDTFLFARGPAVRRNFLNTTLVAWPQYFSALVQYHRVLKQRNAALKDAREKSDVAMWTQLLVEHAAAIWAQRQLFAQFLATHLKDIYASLGGEVGDLTVTFIPGAPSVDGLLATLEEAWSQELRYRYTLYGPHRDDIDLRVDGHPVSVALSRGQTRLLVIAMKIAAYQFMKQLNQEEPVVLLDEVLSELDDEHQHTLLEHLPSAQTLLTCTRLPQELRKRSDVHMLDLRKILATEEVTPTPERVAVPA